MSRPSRIRLIAALTSLLAAAGIAIVATLALAKSTTTLQTAHSSTLGETVVVSAGGRTVYALSPETSHRLLCKSKACFGAWPPLTVSRNAKLSAAHGIKGKLAKLHRDGFYQVTLAGQPLYRFAGDGGAGQVNGNGIKSFGGTWHVVATSAAHHTTTVPTGGGSPSTTTSATTMSTPSPTTTTTASATTSSSGW